MIEHVVERARLRLVGGFREQMDDDLGIARRLKNVPLFLIFSVSRAALMRFPLCATATCPPA